LGSQRTGSTRIASRAALGYTAVNHRPSGGARKEAKVALIGDVTRAVMQISSLNDLQSWLTSGVRGTRGLIVKAHNRRVPPRPERPLELYEFEACPFCRKVREALTELDLAYVSRTCAKGATTKREEVVRRGGRKQFPYLVDPNAGVELYESEAIITYLAQTYGGGRSAWSRGLAPVNTSLAMAASLIRSRGGKVRTGLGERQQPKKLLVLYNFEASPFCRKVRESLNELNLDYRVESVGKLSSRRPELRELGGKLQVPFLIDPNSGAQLYESEEIIRYLERTYARPPDAGS
jgi:glutathione S-transferase